MTIAPDLGAQILRLYAVEKWRVGTIARQLHVHRDVVRRVLAGTACRLPAARRCAPAASTRTGPSCWSTLTKFPTLTAARLHAMVRERGYVGSAEHFRHLVAGIVRARRPRPTCACARCPASRRRSTGGTSATCRSAAPGAR